MTASSPRIINEWMKEWWFFWSSQVRWTFQLRQKGCASGLCWCCHLWTLLPISLQVQFEETKKSCHSIYRYLNTVNTILEVGIYTYVIMIFVKNSALWCESSFRVGPVLMMPFHWLVGLVVLLPGGWWVKCFVKMVTFDVQCNHHLGCIKYCK